ncbi:AmmeMemoRadiSam system protein B [Magnetofaba australis]|uniref:MEMO1 family protein MAIT1_03235 n=1 Tax=Magnetofaba australis IT-1 TaxID=1434232 RepID=A0A1Y2K6C2_9PROT|nr:AmmeMemoRadiSam system protein B [Magnetofaba australis]OSM05093.1 putative dioxygenase [Magnetofaba australis IT-1]
MTTLSARPPAVAGMFYPDEPDLLRRTVAHFLSSAPKPQTTPCAVVAPHAGYRFSGVTAGYAYNGLPAATEENPRRVFLVGPSHRVYLDGVSVGDYSAFATPMGDIPLDLQTIGWMLTEPDVSNSANPHAMEHSLETQLPFLLESVQHMRLIPMVYGRISHERLAQILQTYASEDDLIVVSSDLSHFHDYDTARRLDSECHDAVAKQSAEQMSECEACGRTGVAALIMLAKQRGWRSELADYRNSGDTAGDKNRVVGYASYLYFDHTEQAA